MQTYREQVYDSDATEKMPGWREAAGEKYASWANNSLRKWGDWLPSDSSARCLDVGCGPGNVAFALRAHGLTDITGVDRCEEWAEPVRKTGARFVQSDAVDYLRAHPREYNLITAFDIVEHFNKGEILGFLTAAFEAL